MIYEIIREGNAIPEEGKFRRTDCAAHSYLQGNNVFVIHSKCGVWRDGGCLIHRLTVGCKESIDEIWITCVMRYESPVWDSILKVWGTALMRSLLERPLRPFFLRSHVSWPFNECKCTSDKAAEIWHLAALLTFWNQQRRNAHRGRHVLRRLGSPAVFPAVSRTRF